MNSLFRDARSRANGESDAKIVPIRNELRNYWEESAKLHEAFVERVKKAIEYCSSLQ